MTDPPRRLALLKKLEYPRSEAGLASAALIDEEGYELTGNRVHFEMLAGFVAGDANHCRAGRRRGQLHHIAEGISEVTEADFAPVRKALDAFKR